MTRDEAFPDSVRGKIRNREYAKQIRDFSGLRYGNITPTDIDGLIDFGNRVFIYMEFKYAGKEIDVGQRLALERAVDNLQAHGKPTTAIIARHNTPSDEDIDTAMCIVDEIRFKNKWYQVANQKWTVKEAIDKFLFRYAPRYLNNGGIAPE